MSVDHEAAELAPRAPRPRWVALPSAAVLLWAPCLVGWLVVRDSPIATETFWKFFAVIPGAVLPIMMRVEDPVFLAVAIALTVFAFAVLYVAIRRFSALGLAALLPFALLILGYDSYLFGCIARA